MAQLLAIADTGMAFGTGFTTMLNDLSFDIEIQALTGAQWTALGATGPDIIMVGSGSAFSLGLGAAKALAATAMAFDHDPRPRLPLAVLARGRNGVRPRAG